jgi:hypothetical protein
MKVADHHPVVHRQRGSRIFDELPHDTWFYPGRGDDSTLGEERPKLGEWRERGW